MIPIGCPTDRPRRDPLRERFRFRLPVTQVAEFPVFGPLTQFRGVSVSLDVSCDGKEVLVALDGERFEPTLVHMPHSGGVVMGVVSLGVISLGVSQPEVMTETPHFTILTWANQKVIVIWHQVVHEKFDLESL